MSEPRRALTELLLIAMVGVAIALTANAMNPDGLSLSRNYFPPPVPVTRPAATVVPVAPATRVSATGPASSNPATTAATDIYAAYPKQVQDKLKAYDLKPISHDETVALFRDPSYAAALFVFVDARSDDKYAAGHIPGAYQLFHFYPERYMDEVFAVSSGADRVVVYCHGGDCEDSVQSASLLRNKGLDPAKLQIYVGGFEEWERAKLPIERGARGSGDIVEGGK